MLPGVKKFLSFASLTLLLACLVSCGPTSPFSSHPQVVGPDARQAKPDEWRSAVAIFRNSYLSCSGSLLAPNLVVTAAHCVKGVDAHNFLVRVGVGSEPDFFQQKPAKAIRTGVSPWYKKDVSGDADVGYLVLDRNLDDVEIVPAATDSEELRELLKAGAKATLVGYGIHDNDTLASDVKYIGPARVRLATGNEVYLGDADGDACKGDSGGPAYGQLADGAWRLYGVISRGPTPCAQEGRPGIAGLLAWHLCWIEQNSGIALAHEGLDCAAFGDAIATPTQSDSLLALCKDERLSAATRHTLAALKAEYARQSTGGMRGREVTCEALATWARRVTKLDLASSMLVDVEPLRHFPAVAKLDLANNRISELAALTELAKLAQLRVAWNDVADFAPLRAAMQRGTVVLGQDLQRPRKPLARQEFLERCRAARREQLLQPEREAVVAIQGWLCDGRSPCTCEQAHQILEGSHFLSLSALAVEDLSALTGAVNLQHLDLAGLSIADVRPLASLENLEWLNIEGAALGNVEVLDELVARNGLTIVGRAPLH